MKSITSYFLVILIVLMLNFSFVSPLFPSANAQETVSTENEFEQFRTTQSIYEFELTVGKNIRNFYIIQENLSESTSFVEVFFVDGTTDIYDVHAQENVYGEEEAPESAVYSSSDLFSFENIIEKVIVHSNNSNTPTIKEIDSKPIANYINKMAYNSDSYVAQKEFFSNLGLNVKLREEWGAPVESEWNPYYSTNVRSIVVHHTATQPNISNPAQAVLDIYNYHYSLCAYIGGSYNPDNPNPDCDEPAEWWEDIGYNYLIDQNGTIYHGRDGINGTIGAHSPPNSGTIGIALIGNFVNSMPTQAAQDSLALLSGKLAAYNGIDPVWGSTILGHRNRQNTECPGEQFYNTLANLTSRIREITYSSVDLLEIPATAKLLIDNRDEDFISRSENTIEMIASRVNTSELLEIQMMKLPGVNSIRQVGDHYIFNVEKNYAKKAVIELLAFDSNSYTQPNFLIEKTSWTNVEGRAIPSDYSSNNQWNLELVDATEAWYKLGGCQTDDLCGGSSDVVVAVIDTGVAYQNVDINFGTDYEVEYVNGLAIWNPTNIEGAGLEIYDEGFDRRFSIAPELIGTNFVAAKDTAWEYLCQERAGSLFPCSATELSKIDLAIDDDGHGTFVTNIIAANAGENSNVSSLAGIAHNVSIMPIKAFFPNNNIMCYDFFGLHDPNCTFNSLSLRVKSSSLIISNSVNYAVANGADIINMSLGGRGFDTTLQQSINNAYNNGVTIVVAAGNDNDNVEDYLPGGMDNVISVGAVDDDFTRSIYSNYGSKIDLVAPVGFFEPTVKSQTFNCYTQDDCHEIDPGTPNKYFYSDIASYEDSFTSRTAPYGDIGTSFASPQVAATAALLKSVNPNFSPAQIEVILKQTATDVGPQGFDEDTGFGVLNIDRAVSDAWTSWAITGDGGRTKNKIAVTTNGTNLYQSGIGVDTGVVWVRSFDGTVWGNWQNLGGATRDLVQMEYFDNHIIQVIRGSVSTKMWYRKLDSNLAVVQDWAEIAPNIKGEPQLLIRDGNLYAYALDGNLGKVGFSAYSGGAFGSWNVDNSAGNGRDHLRVGVINDREFQVISGINSRIPYIRINDGVEWSSWIAFGNVPINTFEVTTDPVQDTISLFYTDTNSQIFESTINANTEIVEYLDSQSAGQSSTALESYTVGNTVYQSVAGRLTKQVFVRKKTLGSDTWSNWVSFGGRTNAPVSTILFQGRLWQSAKGITDSSVYVRSLEVL